MRPTGTFKAARSPVLTREERHAGIVLACTAHVEGDVTVDVLPRSRLRKHQIVTESVERPPKNPKPWVRKKYAELSPPTLSDNVADLERLLARLAPDGDPLFLHDDEGPDDMPAHARAALTATSLSIPLAEGRLALGTWQGIYLYEHRTAPRTRRVAAHLIGE